MILNSRDISEWSVRREVVVSHFAHFQSNKQKMFQIPYRKSTLTILWILCTPDSYRSISERFGISKGTLHYLYTCFVDCFYQTSSTYINWPTLDKMIETSTKIKATYGYPGVIGALDGCHINIKCPPQDKDRKGVPSLVLQGTCDETLRFTDIYCDWPGSVHDARVF
ncbi:Uncharacterised protein r2_g4242 [Pycnogonum litorale]